MKKLIKLKSLLFLLLAVLLMSNSCDSKDKDPRQGNTTKPKIQKMAQMRSPARNSVFSIGDRIALKLSIPDTLELDSAQVFFRGKQVETLTGRTDTDILTEEALPGKAGVRAKLFFSNGLTETHSTAVILNSDIIPVSYRYRKLKSYPHDVGAYTQGLEFYNGLLYEGTGNRNQSTVRKVRLEDGEVLQMRNNASEIFGEGITIFNDRIYQLSYHAQTCFIYELESLKEIQKVYYQNKEGWGLTNDGNELIMSDGSHVIYFLDPDLFTVNRQIEVYDNEGPVKDLNELEYIKGKIWANRYYTDEIVIIDPLTGKLEGRINLKGILEIKDRQPGTDVLNGIAWDEENDRLFVTGKYWPKLFEIAVVPVVRD